MCARTSSKIYNTRTSFHKPTWKHYFGGCRESHVHKPKHTHTHTHIFGGKFIGRRLINYIVLGCVAHSNRCEYVFRYTYILLVCIAYKVGGCIIRLYYGWVTAKCRYYQILWNNVSVQSVRAWNIYTFCASMSRGELTCGLPNMFQSHPLKCTRIKIKHEAA